MRHIIHFDGDAFFVSCEQARNPTLKGKPVVTGQEKGIASALSYEAKALGISRGMPISMIRREFPTAIILPGDYHLYAQFASNMYRILKRFTENVEQYSIDECFADISDVPDPVSFGKQMKDTLELELGITFGVGLASTKVLAKIASKMKKPAGYTVLEEGKIPEILKTLPIGKVWGIGRQTVHQMDGYGIDSAFDLYNKPFSWVMEHFHKNLKVIWHELHGTSIHPVNTEREKQQSIMRSRMLRRQTKSFEIIWSECVRHIESICDKARMEGSLCTKVYGFLKTEAFTYSRYEIVLSAPTHDPFVVMKAVKPEVKKRCTGVVYRACGVTLSGLIPAQRVTDTLFENTKDTSSIFGAIDRIQARYGLESIYIAGGLQSKHIRGVEDRSEKRLYLPILGSSI